MQNHSAEQTQRAQETPQRPSAILSREERSDLTRPNNWRATGLLFSTWALILCLLYLAGSYPGPLTILLVWALLPGRQLSLSVLMHEAGHGTLFTSSSANRWIGHWLCALPTLGDLKTYAAGHLEHHRLAGTPQDPDLPNYQAYPISKSSFRRKIIRDLTGQTGLKLMLAIARGASGAMTRGERSDRSLLLQQIAVQLALFGVLYLLGVGWTWFLWFGTFLTSFMLVVRLRQIAEHAAVPDLFAPDPRQNTRTVEAPAWQRFLIAPSFVNYHMEHHFMAGVPCYNLPKLRQLLRERGYLQSVPTSTDYGEVFRSAVQRA